MLYYLKEIVEQSLKNYGKAIVCDSIEECISISNEIAPEHLELMIQNPMEHLQEVKMQVVFSWATTLAKA